MVLPVVMYGCESWTIKKAECQRIDAVVLKTPESSWDNKVIKPVNSKGNQSWILIGRTDAETEAPILWPVDTGKEGGERDDRGQDGWMASPTQWAWVGASYRRWWRTGRPGMLQFMGSQRVRHDGVSEQQQEATALARTQDLKATVQDTS